MSIPGLSQGLVTVGERIVPNIHVLQGTPPRRGFYRNHIKRVLDCMAIVLALPVILPLIVVLAICVARDGGNPFYSQLRLGRNGRVFRLWKLRSMVIDADDRMEQYLATHPEARLEWDRTQKLRNDPRITRFGRMLRKCSLDELPQLWNVLRGDMSLVGPRPMMVNQQSLYPGMGYYALRPGLTGLWQVDGRNDTSFEARGQFDDAYEAQVSLRTDLTILVKTVGVVINGTGY